MIIYTIHSILFRPMIFIFLREHYPTPSYILHCHFQIYF